MQHLDQEQPAQAIECNDSDKVVDRRDERTEATRIDVDLLKTAECRCRLHWKSALPAAVRCR